MKFCRFLFLALASYASTGMASGQLNPPAWPTQYVKVYTPATPAATINSDAATIFATNGGQVPNDNGQFVNQGYALLFTPGVYSNVHINVGYYTSVLGLGSSYSASIPGSLTAFDTTCTINSPQGNSNYCIGALNSFWRSAENFSTSPRGVWSNTMNPPVLGMTWAVSQAAPLRRIEVLGNLFLFEIVPLANFASGFASGGFMADCRVVGIDNQQSAIISGSQQQWCTRNTLMQASGAKPNWSNGVWNQVFVGCTGAPANNCGNCSIGSIPSGIPPCPQCQNCYTPTLPPCLQSCTNQNPCPNTCPTSACPAQGVCMGNPYTTIAATPIIAEKPYIIFDPITQFSLVVPAVQMMKAGPSAAGTPGTIYSFTDVYVATAAVDTAATINAQITAGNHIILTPGTYNLTESILVSQPNTVVLGIGYPILVSTTGKPCITVGSVNGVRVGGILLQAGSSTTPITPTLLQWGNKGDQSITSGFLYDCFARTGRFTAGASDSPANIMVQINSSNVICDNLWLWRADHDAQGLVCSGKNACLTGAEINGDNVTVYGLACEHILNDLTVWNGNNGSCYFYQAEFPYDATSSYADNMFVGYRVNSKVTAHQAYGVGIYSFFRDHNITVNTAISTPIGNAIHFVNALTRFLNGNGGIASVLNGSYGQNTNGAPAVNAQAPGPAYLCDFRETQTPRVRSIQRR